MRKMSIVGIVLLLIGCTQSPTGETSLFNVSINERDVSLNQEFIADDYGVYEAYSEFVSCGYPGLDKVYTYTDYIIYTYPDIEGIERILEIEFRQNARSPSGITLSSTLQEIRALYGDETEQFGNVYRFVHNQSVLSLNIEDTHILEMRFIYEE